MKQKGGWTIKQKQHAAVMNTVGLFCGSRVVSMKQQCLLRGREGGRKGGREMREEEKKGGEEKKSE